MVGNYALRDDQVVKENQKPESDYYSDDEEDLNPTVVEEAPKAAARKK